MDYKVHLEEIEESYNTGLDKIYKDLSKDIPDFSRETLDSKIDNFKNIRRGSKSWRSYLIRCFADMLGVEESIPILNYIEYLHNCSLVQDDVQDGAKSKTTLDDKLKRRGEKAYFAKEGVDEAVGLAAAGFEWARKYLFELNSDLFGENYENAERIDKDKRSKLHLGQELDVAWHSNYKKALENITVKDYESMIKNKTGALLELGAGLLFEYAGKKENINSGKKENINSGKKENIKEFVKTISEFYQKRDDYLDFTNPEKIGKEEGNDVRERKMNYLVVKYLEENEDKIKEIKKAYINRNYKSVKGLLEGCDVISKVEKELKEYEMKLNNTLGKFPEGEGKEGIKQFMNLLNK